MAERFDFIESLRNHLWEQGGEAERTKEALLKYLVLSMQESFDAYVRSQGMDQVTYEEEDGGVRFMYLKPFNLKLKESVKHILNRFDDRLSSEDLQDMVEKKNEETIQQNRDDKGRLVGFWIDLVIVGASWYEGEKFYVDVFVDLADEGVIEFGIDDPQEIYEIAITE